MTITIIDESGIHTVGDDENVMCPKCYATNDATHKRCHNCESPLPKKKMVVKEIVR
jgi:ribosomal protein L40E